jgi:hypothetical protein
VTEGEVDADERLLLLLGEMRIGEDLPGQIGLAGAGLEDAGLDVERLGRDAQRLGDLLEDLRRRTAQAPLDLAQVRVGDPGQLRQPAQRQSRRGALFPDERTEITPAIGELLGHGVDSSGIVTSIRPAGRRRTPRPSCTD